MFTRRSLGVGGRYRSSVVPQGGAKEDALFGMLVFIGAGGGTPIPPIFSFLDSWDS